MKKPDGRLVVIKDARLEAIITLLNSGQSQDALSIREMLESFGLCNYEFQTDQSDALFVLRPRQPVPENYTILTKPLECLDNSVFLEDVDPKTGLTGAAMFLKAYADTIAWFKKFMESCEIGRIDIQVLNRYKRQGT